MSKDAKDVKISKAKGRPMLTWVGKKPLSHVKAWPAQHVESFSVEAPKDAIADIDWSDWPEKFPQGGLLFHGDNKDVLAYLLANGFRGKVKLIYIDPPFDSGADYLRSVRLRTKNISSHFESEFQSLEEQVQYTDIWANDSYLQFMYERILLLRELLDVSGTMWLHCDWHKSHQLRAIMDEIFGAENFLNEVIWVRSTNPKGSQHAASRLSVFTDTILVYGKSDTSDYFPDRIRIPLSADELEEKYHRKDEKGRFYDGPIIRSASMGARPKLVYEYQGYTPPPSGWRVNRKKLEKIDAEGNLGWSDNGVPFRKLRPEDDRGKPIGNFWNDISLINSQADERSGYPTQKPSKLLERIVELGTNPGEIVLDAFIGSGTASIAAQETGRRWIGCDINKGAIQTTAKRLHTVMQEQVKSAAAPAQKDLADGESEAPKPCQFSFTTWRVNDYDLQIQHNEAVELVAEYIGVTRTRADNYFDGTLGSKLVRIVPFNHPLTPLDIEDLKAELKRRPEEERDIVLVSLGMELAAKKAVEEHNRNRPINRLEHIELRTDKRYGGIIRHEPLSASVEIKRTGENVQVEIHDVFSPTILQRLDMQEGVFRAKIDDWRAVVDCVMIDTDYNGDVFNVALSDIPARKQDLVQGRYELPAPKQGATVAVKIIDMLGEEALVTAQI